MPLTGERRFLAGRRGRGGCRGRPLGADRRGRALLFVHAVGQAGAGRAQIWIARESRGLFGHGFTTTNTDPRVHSPDQSARGKPHPVYRRGAETPPARRRISAMDLLSTSKSTTQLTAAPMFHSTFNVSLALLEQHNRNLEKKQESN